MRGHDIIVIGTSAGGVSALQAVLRELPVDFPAAVFVVMHLAPHVPSLLSEVLLRSSRLPVQAVTGPTKIERGRVYVASPDHHLIVDQNVVTVNRGPRENWYRPSVDVLFRSAARSHGPRVIGVVLTGFLDDGTAGLVAIKREGGVTLVQDPHDAMFPDMPSNALQALRVDHIVPLAAIGAKLTELVQRRARPRRSKVSQEVAIETRIAKTLMMGPEGRKALDKVGQPSTFTCPECQGPLWELKNGKLLRFRCQVGHAFSSESMLTAQQEVVERALWVALGAIESRVALWKRLAGRMKSPHLKELAAFYRAKEQDASHDLLMLRRILTQSGRTRRVAGLKRKRKPRKRKLEAGSWKLRGVGADSPAPSKVFRESRRVSGSSP